MYPSCVEYHFKMCLIMDYKLLVLMSFEVTTVNSMDSQEPSPAVMMATCGLLNEHAAYLIIRHVLEGLNSTEDGTNYVWQLDAPSRRS